MPNLPHLPLRRVLEYDLPRRKTGYGHAPVKPYDTHGRDLKNQVETVLTDYQVRERPSGIDPRLILRIQLDPKAMIDEKTWESCGLTLLSVDENKTFVLFSSDAELAGFKRRLSEYEGGPDPDSTNEPHKQIFASIDEIGEIRPDDRIGRLFRFEGVNETTDFHDSQEYVIDIEIWDFGTRNLNRRNVDQLRQFISANQGHVTDDYIGKTMILLRIRCSGALVKQLLELESIALIDRPPKPSLTVAELIKTGIEDFPSISAPDETTGITVLDSGLTTGHPMLSAAIGEATSIPLSLGDASDADGHGTMVAGIALYGDVESCIRNGSFSPHLMLYSARVLNDHGQFDDESLITSQMQQAIEYFLDTYGCKVFNVSLGDDRLPYKGGKVSPWASILDTLSRELDVVIIVSAGNYRPDPSSPDGYVQNYPNYLLDDSARIIEPATGAIVVTVGSFAHSANVPATSAGHGVALRPIAQPNEPSPFTRSGPGLGGSVKPELCEVGGNLAYDGLIQRLRSLRELSVISTNNLYLQQLFRTDFGTSFAAPRVANIAANLYRSFPDASANLIRALLVASAEVPEAASDVLGSINDKACIRVCGYGQPNLESATSSDEARVVLYADSQITLDNFHIYEIPIPNEFIEVDGERRISVTLAYDPPVRHTRLDYLGVKMKFHLIRGKSVEEVAETFRKRSKKEEKVGGFSSPHNCPMVPSPTIRGAGTLQKATFIRKRRSKEDYGDTYYLVVQCEKRWMRAELSQQRYAVVAVIEHTGKVNLYNTIRQRVRPQVRVRQRGRA